MNDKRSILQDTSFGKRTAEDEGDELEKYFVDTDEWRRIYAGEIDIVYGPKGGGKSAIYALLTRRESELFDRGVLLAAAENMRGAPVFGDLVADPPSNEEEVRRMWKLYFLSVIGNTLREFEVRGPSTEEFLGRLEEASLLPAKWSLKRSLASVREYLAQLMRFLAIEGEVKVDPGGTPTGFAGKIVFREPTPTERKAGLASADGLYELADGALAEAGFELWIVLDRLDIAFAESADLERNALRALFRVYLDLLGTKRIGLRIFLRDDIWARISGGGFREASHVTRSITLKWNNTVLLNLIVRRLLRNSAILDYCDVEPETILADTEEQTGFFYRLFPEQIDVGPNKPSAFDWMLSRTRDGTRENVPRELIHLFSEARRIQLTRIETGIEEPDDERLFERVTFREALPEVSRVRLENTLYAEYPETKPWLEALEGEKTEQRPETLAKIWGVKIETALDRAEQLAQIGFFERRGPKRSPSFWVPFLYRPALRLVQGSAFSGG